MTSAFRLKFSVMFSDRSRFRINLNFIRILLRLLGQLGPFGASLTLARRACGLLSSLLALGLKKNHTSTINATNVFLTNLLWRFMKEINHAKNSFKDQNLNVLFVQRAESENTYLESFRIKTSWVQNLQKKICSVMYFETALENSHKRKTIWL